MMTINEVAEYLHLHPTTVYRLIKHGDLPACKIGDLWRIGFDELDEWRQEKTRKNSRSRPVRAS